MSQAFKRFFKLCIHIFFEIIREKLIWTRATKLNVFLLNITKLHQSIRYFLSSLYLKPSYWYLKLNFQLHLVQVSRRNFQRVDFIFESKLLYILWLMYTGIIQNYLKKCISLLLISFLWTSISLIKKCWKVCGSLAFELVINS